MVEQYHPDLRGTRIEYVFKSKATKKNGRATAGTAQKYTGLKAMLATPGAQSSEDLAFFVVTIAKDIWETLDERRKEALVDHELEHCAIEVDEDGDAHLTMRSHDIEEFSSIVGRHGLWSDDLEWFVSSLPAEQLTLAGERDLAVTISHAGADGHVESVDTTTGAIRTAADLLKHGSGLWDADRARTLLDQESPGHGAAEAAEPES